jgi:hypothetical protein
MVDGFNRCKLAFARTLSGTETYAVIVVHCQSPNLFEQKVSSQRGVIIDTMPRVQSRYRRQSV